MPISEVGPSQTFYYLIRVTNLGDLPARDIRIRDWLPDEISGAAVLEPDEGLLSQGNMVQVDISYLEPGASRYIVIRAVSPQFVPATLYNYAYLTADDDGNKSNNRCQTRTYVRPSSYTKQDAIASFEDLLHRQNRLYKSFNLLLNKIDLTETGAQDSMVDFLAAYENLLRVEANLYMSFYNLLNMKYENTICP
ncbi:MAG TPA: hypothetical protein PKX20_05220 [Methanothrix soehngenii]|nr:hypothetical protein [Methanothrix soehngenii]